MIDFLWGMSVAYMSILLTLVAKKVSKDDRLAINSLESNDYDLL